jgi:hypothetical protein
MSSSLNTSCNLFFNYKSFLPPGQCISRVIFIIKIGLCPASGSDVTFHILQLSLVSLSLMMESEELQLRKKRQEAAWVSL